MEKKEISAHSWFVPLGQVTWGGSEWELDWFVPAEDLTLEILSVIP